MSHMFFGGSLPPEFQAEINRRNDLAHMSYEDSMHRLLSFLDALDEEQLSMVYNLLTHAGESPQTPQGTPMSNYYQAMISTHKLHKYNLCFCGQKHPDGVDVPTEQIPEGSHPKTDPNFPLRVLPREFPELLDEYNMEVTPIEGNPDRVYLRCKGCQTPSQSMQDRMLREPGVKGCSTCQQKQKWG